ncbi:MAG: regulatory protein RecX [Xanthomonadales bacterium]|nr:recombination regulator RecX [Gammaproteobacteria bacterium]NNE05933.1 regulatory protein RecX [Xanthomonadales bacterium]NNL95429.1 regulatory protein RecX [Xanthomonadales bacterium]
MTGQGDHKPGVSDARSIAYRFLGNREHSCQELREKLERKGVDGDIAYMAVDELAEEGLVSDRRYAESFARSRVARLQGPFKIRAELRNRGVTDVLIDEALAGFEQEWIELAAQWISRRSRDRLDKAEKARLYRNGTRRGFSHEHMMRALETFE